MVFESDDWGSNRISTGEDFDAMTDAGVIIGNNSYDKFDTIEKSRDLELLFEVLTSVKDKNSNHAVFTPFVNTANPDFKKIEESNFEEYFYEPFDSTLEWYGERNNVLGLYRAGINGRFFMPQFHGREHVTVSLWMKYLQNRNAKVRKAFEHKFHSCNVSGLNGINAAFRPSFYFESEDEIPFLRNSIIEGTNLFEKIIGYRATVFDPPNGVFPSILEKDLSDAGIQTIVTNRIRPEPLGNGKIKKRYFSFGQVNNLGQTYYIRNCQFEPYDNRSVDHCLSMMEAAFRWGKPAIVCTHRVNFNGGIDPGNRDRGLRELKELLDRMLSEWPDIEFMSSGQFAELLREDVLY